MTIATYVDLKNAVQTYCGRSDTKFGTAIETMVGFVEDRIYNGYGRDENDPLYSPAVRSAAQEIVGAITVSGGVGSLPPAALELRRINPPNDRRGIEYMTPDELNRRKATGGGGSEPLYYTIEGATISLHPAFSGTLDLLYYTRYPALTPAAPVSVMLTAYPTLYLAGVLYEAFIYMQEGDLAGMHLARFRSQAIGINTNAMQMRYAGKRKRMHTAPIG